MTERVSGFFVTLEQDIREDDIAPTIEAIKQLRHVLDVMPIKGEVANIAIAKGRIKIELIQKIINLIRDETS